MSILIKNMEMPDQCIKCDLLDFRPTKKNYKCPLTKEIIDDFSLSWGYRSRDCPLIEVPTPHGRLIDADALMKQYAEKVRPSNNSDFISAPLWNDAVQLTENAPTIIESEE